MKWLSLAIKLPKMLGLMVKLNKEAREAFDIIKEKVDDPQVQKEIDDVKKVLAEFS